MFFYCFETKNSYWQFCGTYQENDFCFVCFTFGIFTILSVFVCTCVCMCSVQVSSRCSFMSWKSPVLFDFHPQDPIFTSINICSLPNLEYKTTEGSHVYPVVAISNPGCNPLVTIFSTYVFYLRVSQYGRHIPSFFLYIVHLPCGFFE